ncbi:MAG: hypothetical protein JWN49_339 [Parcubacteria group bacterium]|nr:hypothetical protein [Parcubacteria group bacterium]
MSMKRIFIIIAGVIVLIGLLVGIYFLFFSKGAATLTVGDPFGNTGAGTATGSGLPNTDGTLSNAGTELAPRLIKVTDGPVARGTVAMDIQLPIPGADPTASTSSTTPQTTPDVEAHFIDRASGNVYAYIAHARTLTRISNKTLPGIQEASWLSDGSRAYARFLSSSAGSEHIDTYSLDAHGGGGYLLEQNLSQAVVVGSSTFFSLLSGTTGSVGIVAKADGSNARTLFSSLLSSIVVHPTNGNFFATNKPSAFIDGYAFQIDRATGAFGRVLGPYSGLSILPNSSGTAVLYSYVDAGVVHLRVLDVNSHTTTALPLATLADKCTWSTDNLSAYCGVPTALPSNLPDSWYQGAALFTDRIWKIDLTQRVATLVVDPTQVGNVSIDAVALTTDPAEDILMFTDKHTGALYAYDL